MRKSVEINGFTLIEDTLTNPEKNEVNDIKEKVINIILNTQPSQQHETKSNVFLMLASNLLSKKTKTQNHQYNPNKDYYVNLILNCETKEEVLITISEISEEELLAPFREILIEELLSKQEQLDNEALDKKLLAIKSKWNARSSSIAVLPSDIKIYIIAIAFLDVNELVRIGRVSKEFYSISRLLLKKRFEEFAQLQQNSMSDYSNNATVNLIILLKAYELAYATEAMQESMTPEPTDQVIADFYSQTLGISQYSESLKSIYLSLVSLINYIANDIQINTEEIFFSVEHFLNETLRKGDSDKKPPIPKLFMFNFSCGKKQKNLMSAKHSGENYGEVLDMLMYIIRQHFDIEIKYGIIKKESGDNCLISRKDFILKTSNHLLTNGHISRGLFNYIYKKTSRVKSPEFTRAEAHYTQFITPKLKN